MNYLSHPVLLLPCPCAFTAGCAETPRQFRATSASTSVIPDWTYETGQVSYAPTAVASGVDGSTMFFRGRRLDTAEFIFIDGNNMWVRKQQYPDIMRRAFVRGEVIRGTENGIQPATPMSSNELTTMIIDEYETRNCNCHIPFLIGTLPITTPTTVADGHYRRTPFRAVSNSVTSTTNPCATNFIDVGNS